MLNGLGEAAGRAIERAREAGRFYRSTISPVAPGWARRSSSDWRRPMRLAPSARAGGRRCGRRSARKRNAAPCRYSNTARCQPPALPRVLSSVSANLVPNPAEPGLPADGTPSHDELPPLPAMPLYEEVVADYRTAGLSLRAHPISFYREQLARLGDHARARLGESGE